jgi:GNAT superfamily N-acetyltransferase
MGNGNPLPSGEGEKLISDLSQFPGYFGFLVKFNGKYVGVANCFKNYSTFNVSPVLNIHDFFIEEEHRGKGFGLLLMGKVIDFAKQTGFCKITLEVREDNFKAQNLYKKSGFGECSQKMLFWEKKI